MAKKRMICLMLFAALGSLMSGCPFGGVSLTTSAESEGVEIKASLMDLWAGTGAGVAGGLKQASIPLLPDIPGRPEATFVMFPGEDGRAIPIPTKVQGKQVGSGRIRYAISNEMDVSAVVQLFLAPSKPFGSSTKNVPPGFPAAPNSVLTVTRIVPPKTKDLLIYEPLDFNFFSHLDPSERASNYQVLAVLPNPELKVKELRVGLGLSTFGSRGATVSVDPAASVTVISQLSLSFESPLSGP